jgi:flagellar hook assembly protein FlgD
MGGRLLRTLVDGEKEPGDYQVVWDRRDSTGEQLSCGIYFYQLSAKGGSASGGETPKFTITRKLILVQ